MAEILPVFPLTLGVKIDEGNVLRVPRAVKGEVEESGSSAVEGRDSDAAAADGYFQVQRPRRSSSAQTIEAFAWIPFPVLTAVTRSSARPPLDS
jgi:hypothetical protein